MCICIIHVIIIIIIDKTDWTCAVTDNTCNILRLKQALEDSSDYLSRWECWADREKL